MRKISYILTFMCILFTSCERIQLSKEYEVIYKNNNRDTLTAVSSYNVGDGYLGFKGKDGTTVGLYKLDSIKQYKVIEYKETYK